MIAAFKFDEFYKHYRQDVVAYDGVEQENFCLRVSSMQSALIKKLGEIGWRENWEFDLGWNLDLRYFVYGVVHHGIGLTEGVIQKVLEAFATDAEPSSWVCHFCVEDEDSEVANQFYIKGDGNAVIEEKEGWEFIKDGLMVNREDE